ncbi:flagellar hook-length control protein FliK [Massilia sp. METH4]|uniref:flagellar hook-length control protein FliK n=1 Tax=Massilia sp. METH4 TaxID=3123041 RepID=UPI0030CD2824
MMINIPSAPGGAAAAQNALPGAAMGGAAIASSSAAEGTPGVTADGAGMPALFSQLLDVAGLAVPTGAAAETAAPAATGEALDGEAAGQSGAQPVDMGLAAMMPVVHFAVAQAPAALAVAKGTAQAEAAAQPRGAAFLVADAAGARQAAADAITANVAATPLAARLLQGMLPAAGEAALPKAGADVRQAAPTAGNAAGGTATQAAATATLLAAQDGSTQAGTDGQGSQPQGDNGATFRGVMAASAPVAGAAAPADTVKLAGAPEQWQQPLRAALGDRLQVTLQKGNDQAVIRLEPPNLGSIEISIRQTAGALHVSMSATHGEVVRQLNAVGDSMRQDLSQRQYGDVAVTVSQASSRSFADSEGRGRQPEREAEQRGPGRALNEGDETNTTFAMLRE